ncbi:N/A [soil metagenome]
MRAGWIFVGALALAAAGIARDATTPGWRWLFPIADPAPAPGAEDRATVRLPGSARTFPAAQLHDMQHAVDWYPNEHPATPGIVAAGHGAANACGFCHLPDGNGRPENAALAGLPADYIKRQVQAFATGTRRPVLPNATPSTLMAATARAATPPEIDQAAAYFSKLRYTPHVRVVEAAAIAFRPGRFVYLPGAGAKQPIGDRVIEVPDDSVRFEQRDAHVGYTAYVSPGAIARGRAIALSGGTGGQSCTLCHGSRLQGGIAPPLAGRSPTMLVRQLAGFATGARYDAAAAPMRALAAKLKQREIVDVAAFAATLRP